MQYNTIQCMYVQIHKQMFVSLVELRLVPGMPMVIFAGQGCPCACWRASLGSESNVARELGTQDFHHHPAVVLVDIYIYDIED